MLDLQWAPRQYLDSDRRRRTELVAIAIKDRQVALRVAVWSLRHHSWEGYSLEACLS
jgi:hypothetical protein